MNPSTATTPPTTGPEGTAGDSGASITPLTVDEAIDALLKALELDERDISELGIRASGGVRIFHIDRTVTTVHARALKRYKRDRDGFIIREEDSE